MCTQSAKRFINNVWVDYNFVTSDHHPLFVSLDFTVNAYNNDNKSFNSCKTGSIKWDSMSKEDISLYRASTSTHLADVELNHELILCDDVNCKSVSHQNSINRM